MNKEIQKLIVNALRSGEYKQGRYFCKQEDCFCFTGVILDLYRKEKGGTWKDCCLFHNDWDFSNSIVRVEVLDWLSIKHNAYFGRGLFYQEPNKIYSESYVSNNDSGKTFNELADLVEKYGIC